MEYVVGKAEAAASALKSAISKVFGIYDVGEDLIHIDDTVSASKQNFLTLHETGHHELQRRIASCSASSKTAKALVRTARAMGTMPWSITCALAHFAKPANFARGSGVPNMAVAEAFRAGTLDWRGLQRFVDWTAIAVAVSLPWSTTATGILVVAWLLSTLPTLDLSDLRREITTAAGGLPVLLCVLGTLGLFWADVRWSERLYGLDPFTRFLVIPLLLAQFRRSERGMWVFFGFLLSVTGVLLLSWLLVLFPSLALYTSEFGVPRRMMQCLWCGGLSWHSSEFGVPVKDYIWQSDAFLICAVALFTIAFDQARARALGRAAVLVALGAAFIANIIFVATGETTLLVAPVLVLLLGWREFRWKGLLGGAGLLCVIGSAALLGSPYLRARLNESFNQLHAYESSGGINSMSKHIEFLKNSVAIVRTAPIIGHGAGSIPEQFRKVVVGKTGAAGVASNNPHNEIFAIAIQLGLIGVAVLIAMWAAHFLLFRGAGLTAWVGMIVVTQNVVSSVFNSHLMDFTQSWLYIFGVGVAGGMVLKNAANSTDAGSSTALSRAA